MVDGDVEIRAGVALLAGHLTVPERACGLVVFAHGSANGRRRPRSRFVSTILNRAGMATLLVDLLTRDEELDPEHVFDIGLLAGRLSDATWWVRSQSVIDRLPIAYFGSSTGAAAALWAAAEPGSDIAAVVSRGGRADLAGARLGLVRAPTLLVVGGNDDVVLTLTLAAQARLNCEHRVAVVPGATHLFDEPGTLRRVADLTREWYVRHWPAPAAVQHTAA